jgi:hypothetical protein
MASVEHTPGRRAVGKAVERFARPARHREDARERIEGLRTAS